MPVALVNPKSVPPRTIRLSILASGEGSNAERIVDYFRRRESKATDSESLSIIVDSIVSNNAKAPVLRRAAKLGVTSFVCGPGFVEDDYDGSGSPLLRADYVILAGFLWKVPPLIIRAFPGKILNIHPSLLPSYGGHGMYGARVHRAVVASGDPMSGITVHLVNEDYDEGPILFRKECASEKDPDELERKVRKLELAFYPKVIADYVKRKESAGFRWDCKAPLLRAGRAL